MKKIMLIMLTALLFTGCSNNDGEENINNSDTNNQEPNTEETDENESNNDESEQEKGKGNNENSDNTENEEEKSENTNSTESEDEDDMTSGTITEMEDEKHEYTCSELEDMTTKQKADLPQDVKHKYGLSDDGRMNTECTSSKEQIEYNEKVKQLEDKGIGKEERQIATIWLQEIGRKDVDVLRVADIHEGNPVIWPDKDKSATYKEPVKQLSSKGVEDDQVIFSINKGEATYNFYENHNPSDKPDNMNTYEYTKEIVENPEIKDIVPGSDFDGFDVLEMAEKIEYVGPEG